VLEFIFSILAAIRVSFRSRGDIAIEVLALRQQVAVLKRRRVIRKNLFRSMRKHLVTS